MPESTSPVPAVASRSSPAVEMRARPAARHDGGRALQQHDGTGRGGRASRGQAVGPGRRPASAGRTRRRGGEDRGGVATLAGRSRTVGRPGQRDRPSPSTTVGTDARRASSRTPVSPLASPPTPGPPRGPGTGREFLEDAPPAHETRSAASGSPPPSAARDPGVNARAGEPGRCPAPARIAAAAARQAAPVMPGEPATMASLQRSVPLVASRRRGGGSHAARRPRSPGGLQGPAHVEARCPPARPRRWRRAAGTGAANPASSAAKVTVR